MKPVWTVLFATCLVAPAIAQDTSKPVEYVARALPLHQVLLDLEKKSGVRLDCDPAMENEPVIIKLNGVPLQDALDKIALVFAADWVKHDHVLRLERSAAKLDALHREVFDGQVARVRSSLESLKRRLQDQSPINEAGAPKLLSELLQLAAANEDHPSQSTQMQLLQKGSRLPSTRLGMQIVSNLNPVELVGLAEGGRFVYATNPNSAQHSLPDIPRSVLEEWRSARQALNSAYDRMPNKPQPGNFDAEEIARDMQSDDRLPARILVTSQRRGTTLPISLYITLYDQSGRILAQDIETLGASLQQTYAFRQAVDASRRKAQLAGFELGPIGRELAPRMGANRAGLRPLPQFVKDALSHPTEQDPLSFAASDIILTSSDLEGINAIALLDDSAETLALSSARTGKTSLETFKTLVEKEDACRVSVEGDWLVARPTEPLKVQWRRAPRPVLEQMILDDQNQGYLTIEQVAEAAYESSPEGIDFMQNAVENLAPSNGNNPTYSDHDALWLFASLTPAQRERAAAPGGFSLTGPALSAEQAEVANHFLFQGDSFVEGVEPPQREFKPGDMYPEPEKTDYFHDGTTSECVLNFTLTTEEVLFQEESYSDSLDGVRYWSPIDPRGIPPAIAVALHPDLLPARLNISKLTHLQKGTKRTLSVRLSRGKVSVSASASEQHLGGGDAMTPQQYVDSLPDAQRFNLERQIEEFLKRVQAAREAETPKPPRS